MNTNQKKAKIRALAVEMLKESHEQAIKKINKALDSGAIDIDKWDEHSGKMLIPKAIVSAVLVSESEQYDGKGTSFEKSQKKEIKNIKLFI